MVSRIFSLKHYRFYFLFGCFVFLSGMFLKLDAQIVYGGETRYYSLPLQGGTFDGEYCYTPEGKRIYNTFFFDGTYTYYLQQDGTPMKNRLTYHPDGEHIIFFDAEGHEVFNSFANVTQTIAGESTDDLCYFDVFGYMYVDVLTYDQEGKDLFYVNPCGVVERNGWFYFSDGERGYADSDGHVARGLMHKGAYYYQLDECDGHLIGYFSTDNIVDVIIFMGQSNMTGHGEHLEDVPMLTPGAAFEYRSVYEPGTMHELTEPFGSTESREGYIVNEGGTGSLVTAFCNAYYEQTQVPVVAVAAASGGKDILQWCSRNFRTDARQRLMDTRQFLKDRGYQIRHTYMVWLQGESDAFLGRQKEEYQYYCCSLFDYMHTNPSEYYDGAEACFLIQIGYLYEQYLNEHGIAKGQYDTIMTAQEEIAASRDDVVMVSTLPKTLQDEQNYDADWIHFNQRALNAIGTDAGTNAGLYVNSLAQ